MTDAPNLHLLVLTQGRYQSALAAMLEVHAPGTPYGFVLKPGTLDEAIARQTGKAPVRLLGFATDILVGARQLAAVEGDAYNLHPGPPDYPGWAPSPHALMEEADVFGVTLHRMVAAVDAGPIVSVLRFPVPEGATLSTLDLIAEKSAYKLLMRVASRLAKPGRLPETDLEWTGRTRTKRDLKRLLAQGDVLQGEARTRWARATKGLPIRATEGLRQLDTKHDLVGNA